MKSRDKSTLCHPVIFAHMMDQSCWFYNNVRATQLSDLVFCHGLISHNMSNPPLIIRVVTCGV